MPARAYDFDYLEIQTAENRVPVFIGNTHVLHNPDRPRFAEPKDQALDALKFHSVALLDSDNQTRARHWTALNEIVEKGAAAVRRQDRINDFRGAMRNETRQAASVNPLTDKQTDALIAYSHVESMVRGLLEDAARNDNALNVEAMIDNLRTQAVDRASGASLENGATIQAYVDRAGIDPTPFLDRDPGALQDLYDRSVRVIYNETTKVTDILAYSYATAGRSDDAALDDSLPDAMTPAERARLTTQILRSANEVDYAPQRQSTEREVEFAINRTALLSLINEFDVSPNERRAIEFQLDSAATGNPLPNNRRTQRDGEIAAEVARLMETPEFGRYKAIAAEIVTGATPAERRAQIDEALSGGDVTRIRGLDQIDIVTSSVAEATIIARMLDYVAVNRGDAAPSREVIAAAMDGLRSSLSHRQVVRQPTAALLAMPHNIVTEGPDGRKTARIHPYWEAYNNGENRAKVWLDADGKRVNAADRPKDAAPPTLGYMAIRRHALLGPNASRLQMAAVGLEGAKYFKHPDVITAAIKDVAEANAKVNTTARTALIAIADPNAESKNDHSRSTAAIIKVAQAAGMTILRVEASLDPSDANRLNAAGAVVEDNRNVGGISYNIVTEGEKLPLYSSHAKFQALKNKTGSLLLIEPKPPKAMAAAISTALENGTVVEAQRLRDQYDRMARAIGWQALQSLADRTIVFGLTDKDYNACQAARRSLDFDKTTVVYDEAGQVMPNDRAYAMARLGAPRSRDEMTQSGAREIFLGPNVESEMLKPAAAHQGRLALAFLTSVRDADRIAEATKAIREKHGLDTPISIRDLIETANLTSDKLRAMDPAKAAIAKDISKALGTDRNAFRSPQKVSDAMQYAFDSLMQMKRTIIHTGVEKPNPNYRGENFMVASTGPLVAAAQQPLGIQGDPALVERLKAPDLAIIGAATSTPDEKMAKVITDLVREAAANNQTISTTNDPTGEIVLKAAKETGAKVLMVTDPSRPEGLCSEGRSRLAEMIVGAQAVEASPSLRMTKNRDASNEQYRQVAERIDARFAATATEARIRALEIAVAPAKAVAVTATPANDPALLVAARAGQDKRIEPTGGKPVVVVAASPARMIKPDQRGSAELLRPGRTVIVETGHSTSITNASVGVRFVDPKTGETDRSRKDRGLEYFGTKAHAVASWVNPARAVANEKAAASFLKAVAEGKAEPMHGKFRAGMTAADVALLTGAARNPTDREKSSADRDAPDIDGSRATQERADWSGTIRSALSKSFRVTEKSAGREAFA